MTAFTLRPQFATMGVGFLGVHNRYPDGHKTGEEQSELPRPASPQWFRQAQPDAAIGPSRGNRRTVSQCPGISDY